MIRSFRDKRTEHLFHGEHAKRLGPDLQRSARRKLVILHAAEDLEDLAALPGNQLEKLMGDRKGQHSIRINDQWRICFRWHQGEAHDVEVVDYH